MPIGTRLRNTKNVRICRNVVDIGDQIGELMQVARKLGVNLSERGAFAVLVKCFHISLLMSLSGKQDEFVTAEVGGHLGDEFRIM